MAGTFSEIQDESTRYVGEVVYVTMTTVDERGRPRARILIAAWEAIDDRPVGWIATFEIPVKTACLGNPPRHVLLPGPEAERRLRRHGGRVGRRPGDQARGAGPVPPRLPAAHRLRSYRLLEKNGRPKVRLVAPGPVARSGGAGRGPEERDPACRDLTGMPTSVRSRDTER